MIAKILNVMGALVLLALGAPAQDEPVVTARLERGVLKMGQRTVLVVQVEGTDSARLGDVPDVEGLRIGTPSTPSRRSFVSVVGRRTTTSVSMTWSIPIRPEREGEFTLPPIPVIVGNRVVSTTPQRLTVVQDMRGEELGFLEVSPSATRVVQGQLVSIEVHFGWDQALSQIDYADLSLGFWEGFPGLLEVEADFPPRGATVMGGVTVNRAEEVQVQQLGTRELRGRSFHSFRLVRTFVATRTGRLELSASFLNFAKTETSGGFFDTRRRKVEDYYASAPVAYIEVVELPEEGRPFEFTGAIGSFSALADADRRDVDAGDSIKLTVTWEGQGNLEFFDAPEVSRDPAFTGFRVYGRTEDREPGRRKVVYDLAPLEADLEAIPPVKLAVFDPELGAYTTVATQPIPIRVRPLANAVELDAEERLVDELDLRDLDTRPLGPVGTASGGAPSDELVLGTLFGVPILWLLVRTAVRRRGDPAAPLERRRRGARRRLARALARARGPQEELEAVYAFLAERTRSPEGAWVGADLEQALAPTVEEEAARAQALVDRLEGSVWSGRNGSEVPGGAERAGRDEILRVADALIARGL